jgi:uncharacterized protein (TIGR02246 family)
MSSEDDRAVRSEPVTTEEGDEVVVTQQNVGPGNQVGGGEFKNVERGKTPDEAAAEQHDLATEAPTETDEVGAVRGLHRRLLEAWATKDARTFAEFFAPAGTVIGVDGRAANGRDEIRSVIDGEHAASSVADVRDVRLLTAEVALLQAVADDAIQTMVAVKDDTGWRVALLQSTPNGLG